jgi:glutathione peroxidase
MKKRPSLFLIVQLALVFVFLKIAAADNGSANDCPATLNFTKRTLAGEKQVNLCKEYLGKVIVVVNTASKCGFTPQYDGLEALYRKYKSQGLVVLGFPSNDFGAQEPGSEKQIQEFCKLTYGVEFPMFEKTRVVKPNADPLYRALGELAGEYPAWNFHKYLIDRDGRLVASFNSRVEPQSDKVIQAIEQLL